MSDNFILVPQIVKSEKKVSIRLPLQSFVVPYLKQLKADSKFDIPDTALTRPLEPTMDKETGLQKVSSTGNPIYHVNKDIRNAVTGLEQAFLASGYKYITQGSIFQSSLVSGTPSPKLPEGEKKSATTKK